MKQNWDRYHLQSSQSKLTRVQKNMTEGAKNNYAQVLKLDPTFLALFSIFLKFSVVFVKAEED